MSCTLGVLAFQLGRPSEHIHLPHGILAEVILVPDDLHRHQLVVLVCAWPHHGEDANTQGFIGHDGVGPHLTLSLFHPISFIQRIQHIRLTSLDAIEQLGFEIALIAPQKRLKAQQDLGVSTLPLRAVGCWPRFPIAVGSSPR